MTAHECLVLPGMTRRHQGRARSAMPATRRPEPRWIIARSLGLLRFAWEVSAGARGEIGSRGTRKGVTHFLVIFQTVSRLTGGTPAPPKIFGETLDDLAFSR